MKIIPAIDLIGGKCVRLTQGDYAQKKVYNEHPLEVAQQFEDSGIQHLHLVDLDGAKSGHIVNHKVLELITTRTQLRVDFGGGVKSDLDIKKAFDCGAQQVTCGSIAVKNEEIVQEWIELFGSERLILGADVKNKKVAIHGWMEETEINIKTLINKYSNLGLKNVICTDIATDGMLAGPNLDLYIELLSTFNDIQLISSGGVSSLEDLKTLKKNGLHGAIVGKAIYEGRISLAQLTSLSDA
ncbi:MAG: 1-(5-phosphoribosyl)-5-[(5-phosphoribosylamino)methylideneamino]imidazole-4-carboxamide isomerase [Bacteroidota bacterium]